MLHDPVVTHLQQRIEAMEDGIFLLSPQLDGDPSDGPTASRLGDAGGRYRGNQMEKVVKTDATG